MIPLLGPSTVRDAAGNAIDSILPNPLTYLHDDALRAGLMMLHFIDFKADLLSTRDR
ncbi:MAG: MlaA family lipoprotein [Gammaproteobacteria bacterium]